MRLMLAAVALASVFLMGAPRPSSIVPPTPTLDRLYPVTPRPKPTLTPIVAKGGHVVASPSTFLPLIQR